MALAAAGPALSAIGTIGGLASSAFGIMQGQQQAQQQQQAAAMQAQQAQENMNQQYAQAQQSAFRDRQAQVQKHIGETRAQQANHLSYYRQLTNNNEAANKSYVQEQVKLNEARSAAAFKAQANYAKSIGARGKLLATGATGQSVGLLALDVERQQGFADAEQNASLRSAEQAAAIGADVAYTQAKSANNTAYSNLMPTVQAPLLTPDPSGVGENLNLGIPTYNWS
jgi:hypothetical protein